MSRISGGRIAGLAARTARATAALEFALMSPVLLLLFVGIYSFGLYFFVLIAVTNAAAEGARASVSGLTDTSRSSLATAAAEATFAQYAPFLTTTAMSVSAQPSSANTAQFEVGVSYDVSGMTVLSLVQSLFSLPLKPSIVMTAQDAGYY